MAPHHWLLSGRQKKINKQQHESVLIKLKTQTSNVSVPTIITQEKMQISNICIRQICFVFHIYVSHSCKYRKMAILLGQRTYFNPVIISIQWTHISRKWVALSCLTDQILHASSQSSFGNGSAERSILLFYPKSTESKKHKAKIWQ